MEQMDFTKIIKQMETAVPEAIIIDKVTYSTHMVDVKLSLDTRKGKLVLVFELLKEKGKEIADENKEESE